MGTPSNIERRNNIERRLAPVLVLAFAGCASQAQFLDPEADLAFYERVGIIPFTSLSPDTYAGQKTADIFFTELLRREFAQVVEPGQFVAAMNQVRGGTPLTNPWSTEELQRLAEATGAQGIFLGTVRDYGQEQVGRDAFPIISLEVRLVDTASGRIAWTASRTRRGGPGVPFFGFGEVHTQGELTAEVCQDLLSELPRRSVQ